MENLDIIQQQEEIEQTHLVLKEILEKVDNTYICSRLGDVDAQFRLLEMFRKLSSTITNSYLKSLKNFGVNYDDLDDCLVEAYTKLLDDDGKVAYNTPDYFKYLYIQGIKTLMRKRYRFYEREGNVVSDYISELINEDNYSEDPIYNRFYESDEYLNYVLNDVRARLNKDEKRFLILYIKGYTVTDMAEMTTTSYSYVFRTLKSALKKAKEYLEKYHNEN